MLVPSRRPLDGRPVRAPGEDFVFPGADGVHDSAELGDLAGGVEGGEAPQGGEGGLVVLGEVEAVELGEGVPGGPQAGMPSEELLEAFGFVGGEPVGAAEENEPGSEHFRVEHRGVAVASALGAAAHGVEAGGEPADNVEPAQDVAGVGQPSVDGFPIRGGIRRLPRP